MTKESLDIRRRDPVPVDEHLQATGRVVTLDDGDTPEVGVRARLANCPGKGFARQRWVVDRAHIRDVGGQTLESEVVFVQLKGRVRRLRMISVAKRSISR